MATRGGYLKSSAKKISFRVLQDSGNEEEYEAGELEIGGPFTKGWRSARFCLYPQEILIQLEQTVRVRMIQLLSDSTLITSKIDIFAATKYRPSDHSTFARLGYVSFSDNRSTGYKTRELKSVYVDCYGAYLKLVLHCNHINEWNLYNQIGLVAVNIIGDLPKTCTIGLPCSESEETELVSFSSPHELEVGLDTNDQHLKVLLNKPVSVSHTDDIRFTMTHDPVTAEVLQKLDVRKKKAATAENYEEAKRIQLVMKELSKTSESLCRHEIEKREAVRREDYDAAKEIKIRMDQAREILYHKLGIDTILEEIRLEEPREGKKSKKKSKTEQSDLSPSIGISREHSYLNLITPESSADQTESTIEDQCTYEGIYSKPEKPMSLDSEMLPEGSSTDPVPAFVVEQHLKEAQVAGLGLINKSNKKYAVQKKSFEEGISIRSRQGSLDVDAPPGLITKEELEKKKQRISEPAKKIHMAEDVFGCELVSMIYSTEHSERMKAYEYIMDTLKSFPKDASSSSSLSKDMQLAKVVSVTAQMVAKGFHERTFTLFSTAQDLLMYLIGDFASDHRLSKEDFSSIVGTVLPALLIVAGDMNFRLSSAAVYTIKELSRHSNIIELHFVCPALIEPFKQNNIAGHHIVGRLVLLQNFVSNPGIPSGALTVESLMKYVIEYIDHHTVNVRDEAIKLIVQLYEINGSKIKSFLPDGDNTASNKRVMKILLEKFDKVDEQRLSRKRSHHTAKKVKEFYEGMTKHLAVSLPDQLQGKDNKLSLPMKSTSYVKDALDKTCIFCGMEKEEFKVKSKMNAHYSKDCPMLHSCGHCGQVTEVSSIKAHLMNDCIIRGEFVECSSCKEAIHRDIFKDHTKRCVNVPSHGTERCPLCHLNVVADESGWKKHLMGDQDNPPACSSRECNSKQSSDVDS